MQDCGHNEDDNKLLTFSKIETKENPYKKRKWIYVLGFVQGGEYTLRNRCPEFMGHSMKRGGVTTGTQHVSEGHLD